MKITPPPLASLYVKRMLLEALCLRTCVRASSRAVCRVLKLFSAKGAASSQAWGNVPGFVDRKGPSAEGATHLGVESRFQRFVSDLIRIPGALPQAYVITAPSAFNRYCVFTATSLPSVEQNGTTLTKASVFRASFIRVDSRDSRALNSSVVLGKRREDAYALRKSASRTDSSRGELSRNRTSVSGRFRTKCFGVRCVIASLLGSAALICASSFAQTSDSVAEREVQRRQAGITQGEAALARGQAAMKAKDYAAAHEEFRTAITYLPDAVVSGKAHDEAVEGFCKSGVVLAEARIAEGRYADAEAILSEVLSERYDPKCRPAQELYAHLRQPGYFNKTMSPTFIEKVEQVKHLLTEADGFYNSGRYDLAMKRYDQVLALDPYNTAARKGQEKINNTKFKYGEEAYNETRSRQLWQVQKGWEQPVRRYGAAGQPVAIGSQKGLGGTAQITNKLNSIIIPRIEFRVATNREAIDFLREQSEENDTSGTGKRGVDIVLRMVPLGQVAAPPPPV